MVGIIKLFIVRCQLYSDFNETKNEEVDVFLVTHRTDILSRIMYVLSIHIFHVLRYMIWYFCYKNDKNSHHPDHLLNFVTRRASASGNSWRHTGNWSRGPSCRRPLSFIVLFLFPEIYMRVYAYSFWASICQEVLTLVIVCHVQTHFSYFSFRFLGKPQVQGMGVARVLEKRGGTFTLEADKLY